MKKKIALATLAAVPMTISSVHASGLSGIVTIDSLNARSGPSTTHTILFTANKGEKVQIDESSNGWYKIKTTTGNSGWVSYKYIELEKNNLNEKHNLQNSKVVDIEGLHFRNGAGTSYRIISSLKKGTVLQVVSENNKWTKVKYEGRMGYVYSDYLKDTSDNETNTNKTLEYVNYDFLNVRSGPSTSDSIVKTLKKGDAVNVISENNGWSKISCDGKVAYVSSRYLSEANKNNDENEKDSSSENSGETKVVNYDFLNVRSGPSVSNSKIGQLKKGDKVEIISQDNGWSKIKYNLKYAYVSSEYLSDNVDEKDESQETPNHESTKETKVVNYDFLNVRSGPSVSNSKIGQLKKGDKVEIISQDNGWSKIKYNLKYAYVSSEYLSDNDDKKDESQETPNHESTKETKVVNYDFLNVRSGPSVSNSKIGQLKKGDKVEVVSQDNGWSKIKYNLKYAYVSSEYLSGENITDEKEEQSSSDNIKVVNFDFLNVREKPSTSSTKVGVLGKGDKVKVKDENNGWSRIDFRGNDAYVSSMYLSGGDFSSDSNSNDGYTPEGDGSVIQIAGARVNKVHLGYTLEDHVRLQLQRASIGGNVIDSSIRSSSRGFVKANRVDIQHFLNPNNFTVSKKGMMQFLRLDSYKGGVSARELNSYLNSLSPVSSGTNVFYNQGQTFIDSARRYNIDLAYLVSHAMWETAYGRSVLAQGQTLRHYKGKTLPHPVKVYNFYGIGAIDHSANVSGAEAAYSNGWTSIEATIDGSAKWISKNYIKNNRYKQNNIYKMKFCYDYSWHQYATDVNWANGISGVMVKIVNMYGSGSSLTFDIPKYSR